MFFIKICWNILNIVYMICIRFFHGDINNEFAKWIENEALNKGNLELEKDPDSLSPFWRVCFTKGKKKIVFVGYTAV